MSLKMRWVRRYRPTEIHRDFVEYTIILLFFLIQINYCFAVPSQEADGGSIFDNCAKFCPVLSCYRDYSENDSQLELCATAKEICECDTYIVLSVEPRSHHDDDSDGLPTWQIIVIVMSSLFVLCVCIPFCCGFWKECCKGYNQGWRDAQAQRRHHMAPPATSYPFTMSHGGAVQATFIAAPPPNFAPGSQYPATLAGRNVIIVQSHQGPLVYELPPPYTPSLQPVIGLPEQVSRENAGL